ncbi:MAG: T9SS type A sorting domain-containing protein [Dysgonamonadaceae bacterium]|jgi:hypothetical protein|nr:T9SS type A sorting domain-containing protein [Dysgonamonadaceae bacterium]
MKNKIVLKVLLTVVCLLAGLSGLHAKTIYYVKEDGVGDGSSWNNASGSIQDMIDRAVAGDEVWVAAGTYFPTMQTDADDVRSKTFLMKNGVHLYGSFAGTETAIAQREKENSWAWMFTNQTFLSGNIDGVQDSWKKTIFGDDWLWIFSGLDGNCYNVVTCPAEIVDETVLDGFAVRRASGKRGGPLGAGIYNNSGKMLVRNCEVDFNHGNGIYNIGGTITGCYIGINIAAASGILNSRGIVKGCLIEENVYHDFYEYYAKRAWGGGINNYEGEVSECLIIGNHARISTPNDFVALPVPGLSSLGGGIYNNKGKVDRCYIFDNSTYCYNGSGANGSHYAEALGGGIHNYGGEVGNCCIYNNQVVAFARINDNNMDAYASGGGIYNYKIENVDSKAYNLTVVMNKGGNYNGSGSEKNSITTATDADIHFEKPSSFIGKATTDQQFDELWDADFYLKASSSYIDAGSTDGLPDWIINGGDIDGYPRIHNGKIDLGAFEYDGIPYGIKDLLQTKVTVSFNPVIESVIVSGLEGNESLSFYNIDGQLLFSRQATGETETIPVGHLATGVYFVKTNNGQSLKWVKEL